MAETPRRWGRLFCFRVIFLYCLLVFTILRSRMYMSTRLEPGSDPNQNCTNSIGQDEFEGSNTDRTPLETVGPLGVSRGASVPLLWLSRINTWMRVRTKSVLCNSHLRPRCEYGFCFSRSTLYTVYYGFLISLILIVGSDPAKTWL